MAKDTLGFGEGGRERAPARWVMGSDNPSTSLEACDVRDDVDSSGTLTGRRARATVEGAMASDIPTQSMEQKCRAGDLHSAFLEDKEVANENAQ